VTITAEWAWPQLHEAQRAVLLEILINGSRSRADLARRVGLTRASLTRLTRDLLELGFIEEGVTTPRGSRGRPSEMLNVIPSSAHLIGIKLTGDTLYAELADLGAKPRAVREVPLRSVEVADVVSLIAEVVEGFRKGAPNIAAVGVCLAGDVLHGADGSAVVVGSHFLGWSEVPLQRLLEDALRLPVAVSNDVQALTAGHHWFGAGVGVDQFAVIGVGEGIGAGMIVDGELLRGARGHPGKVGHLALHTDGARCEWGHVGCVSSRVTTPAILQASALPSIAAVLEAADRGDAKAMSALDAATEALGAVVAYLTNLVDPELVVIAGEGQHLAERHPELLDRAIRDRLDPAAEAPRIVVPEFGFEDYARGAAVVALRGLLIPA
jgi:predicted NBD/HSP70 family sugar kinase